MLNTYKCPSCKRAFYYLDESGFCQSCTTTRELELIRKALSKKKLNIFDLEKETKLPIRKILNYIHRGYIIYDVDDDHNNKLKWEKE